MALLKLLTRGSELALIQAREVEARVKALDPSLQVELVTVKSAGDRARRARIEDLGTTGVFTKALEDALAEGAGDAAVHSAKDIPTRLESGFSIAAYLPRADRRDALVTRARAAMAVLVGDSGSSSLDKDSAPGGAGTGPRTGDLFPAGGRSVVSLDEILPTGGVVATGSARRRAQISFLRPDLLFEELRGNMGRRLAAVARVDAVIAGACALDRLATQGALPDGLGVFRIDESLLVPAAGQGAVAVETYGNGEYAELWQAATHAPTAMEVGTERAFLGSFGGGCTVPVGVTAVSRGAEVVELRACVASRDGHRRAQLEAVVSGPDEAAALGREFGESTAEIWRGMEDPQG